MVAITAVSYIAIVIIAIVISTIPFIKQVSKTIPTDVNNSPPPYYNKMPDNGNYSNELPYGGEYPYGEEYPYENPYGDGYGGYGNGVPFTEEQPKGEYW